MLWPNDMLVVLLPMDRSDCGIITLASIAA